MGKKKRGHSDIEDMLNRPWCFYCERDFDDLKILINHQKAKHYKCERCGRRLNTAGGLNVHMNQVHKEQLTAIENALPNRSNLEVEIFGMEGIPDDAAASHKQRVITQFAQAEAEHRAATGNPAPGAQGANAAKKAKTENVSDMKKRLEEHKARMAAQKAAAAATPPNGETPPIDGQNTGYGQAPGFNTPYSQPYGAPPGGVPYGSFQQPFGQPAPALQPPVPGPNFPPGGGAPPYSQQSFSPPAQYPPQYQPGPSQLPFQTGSPAPPPFPSVSPPAPQQGMSLPQRPPSLPTAPGLPQRPSFGAPPVNAFQMQQMHQGQMGAPPSIPYNDQQGGFTGNPNGPPGMAGPGGMMSHESSHLPPPAGAFANGVGGMATPMPQDPHVPKPEPAPSEKKSKKEKDKDRDAKLIYSDNDTSPEEKMARLPRYAFDPDQREETVLGNATITNVATKVEQIAAAE